MSDIWLITGGGRSGKSMYAESIAIANRLPKNAGVLYIATGVATDDEMAERIAIHQKSRPKDWITCERYRDLGDIEKEYNDNAFGNIILDCVTGLLMGILFEEIPDADDFQSKDFEAVEHLAIQEINALCRYAVKYDKRLIFVTNEIGMGIIPETRYSRYYRDALGRINKHIASVSNKAVLMVAGIPLNLK